MDPITLVLLMFWHFVGDFVLQTNWMATNKSKNWFALSLHCLVYSALFLVFGNFGFFCFLYVTHFCVDAITSRRTSKLFKEWYDYQFVSGEETCKTGPNLHNFFVVIGFDQWLHFFALMAGAFYYGILR